MRHVLGVIASRTKDFGTGKEIFERKVLVDDSVLAWLELHDIVLDAVGNKLYICNAVEYAYLGPEDLEEEDLLYKKSVSTPWTA